MTRVLALMSNDVSRMNSVELRELAESLIRQAQEQSLKEFESTMNFLSDKLRHMGKTKKDAVLHLLLMMRSSEAEETLAELLGETRRLRQRERGDLDSEGNMPEVGIAYRLPTGEEWTRKSKMGATKREFAVYAKSSTWSAMKS